MTVKELLSRIDSRELAEWHLHEKRNGTLGNKWDREMLRRIDFRLQQLNRQIAQANTPPKKACGWPEAKVADLPWQEEE